MSQFTSFVAIEKREKVSNDGGVLHLCNNACIHDIRMRSLTNQKVLQSQNWLIKKMLTCYSTWAGRLINQRI